jgi:hypothetical protein
MAAARAELSIVVVRSGGFAGMSRRWAIERPEPDDDWIALVEACPWGRVAEDRESRDRFTWRIEARVSRRRHRASVPDRDLTGPWRDLVDRVQRDGSSDG